MRETQNAAASTIRRRLAALSSLYKHLVRHDHAARNPVGEVERPAINRDEGTTRCAPPSLPQRSKMARSSGTCKGRRAPRSFNDACAAGVRKGL
jgi:integrase/recombinase XerD